MGMLNGFISGFAGAGANILAQRSLEDYRNEADLMKAQRIQDMADARAERLRSESTGRVSGYFAPTTESVAGAATAFDDDGNPTAANDFKVSRETTLGEAIKKSQKAGDLQSAVVMQGMLAKDDATETNRLKADNILETAKIRAESLLKNAESRDATKMDIAELNNDTKMFLATDKDGNPIVKGGGNAGATMNAKLHSATQDMKDRQAELFHMDKLLTDLTLSKADREKYLARQSEAMTSYKEAQRIKKDISEAIMGMSVQQPQSDKPAIAKTLAERGSPADLAAKYKSARGAASALDAKLGPRAKPVAPVGMLAPELEQPDYSFSGAL